MPAILPFLLSGVGRKLAIGAAVLLAVLGVLLGARRSGRLAERVDNLRKAHRVQNEMLKAAANRPRDRSDLAKRLRDGSF